MKTYILKFAALLLLAAAFVAGCNKEESPFAGNDNYIAAFTLVKDGVTLKGAISPDAIVITAPERFSLSGATATVTLSENATITPDPATIADWNTAQTFTVTAYNGTAHRYDYSIERRLISRNGDVVLLTQADVEAFVEEVKDIDQINGSITIGAATGQDTVYSLAGLEHLKVIKGGIIINATYAGEDLTAFESLEKTNELLITSKKVKTVRFPKLAVAHADLNFNQATAIQTLDFPELTAIDKGLRIYYVDSLASLNFPKLQEVIESITMQGRSSGVQNLYSIEFPALQKVGGGFTLSYWREITAVNLPQLTEVNGTFNVTYLNKAESFAAPRLETVGALTMSSCAAMTSVDFDALKTANGNVSPNLAALAEVNFPALETVTGSLSFATSATLTALQFPALKSAGGLTLPNAANLATLDFHSLKYVTGELQISLQSLTSLDAFNALDSVGGRLYLNNLPNLTSLTGLLSLKKAGSLYAYELTNVTEIDVRNIEVGTLYLNGTTYNRLTLIGNDKFPGELSFGALPSSVTVFPVTVQGFEEVGALTLGVSTLIAVDFPWLKRVNRMLQYNGGGSTEILRFTNLKSAGGLSFYNLYALQTLDFPNLEEITGYTSGTATRGDIVYYGSNRASITALEFPKLKSVVGGITLTLSYTSGALKDIRFPKLQSITGTLTIAGASNLPITDLSGFSNLEIAAGVTISNFTQLSDFSPLRKVVCSLPDAAAWKITGCGGTPANYSYEKMTEQYCNP